MVFEDKYSESTLLPSLLCMNRSFQDFLDCTNSEFEECDLENANGELIHIIFIDDKLYNMFK
tara:strand:- start:612 stop:797 length:186 start_codon:yes stop_codon:yes gene_type:complete